MDLQIYWELTSLRENGAEVALARCEHIRPDILLHLGHWETSREMKSLQWLLKNTNIDRLETSIDGKLWTPLHLAVSANFARVMVEHDYSQACEGKGDYDPTMALKMLSVKNSKGQTPRELSRLDISLADAAYEPRIERYYSFGQNGYGGFGKRYGSKHRRKDLSTYLGSWEESPLFVAPGAGSTTTSVIANPTLTEFQMFLAVQAHKHLAQTDLGELPAAAIMGYLAPRDLLNGWDQWGCAVVREKKVQPCGCGARLRSGLLYWQDRILSFHDSQDDLHEEFQWAQYFPVGAFDSAC